MNLDTQNLPPEVAAYIRSLEQEKQRLEQRKQQRSNSWSRRSSYWKNSW